MVIAVVYLLVRYLLDCLTVLSRGQASKDAELLVLRHVTVAVEGGPLRSCQRLGRHGVTCRFLFHSLSSPADPMRCVRSLLAIRDGYRGHLGPCSRLGSGGVRHARTHADGVTRHGASRPASAQGLPRQDAASVARM